MYAIYKDGPQGEYVFRGMFATKEEAEAYARQLGVECCVFATMAEVSDASILTPGILWKIIELEEDSHG